jgi:hypothetical protein
MNAHPEVMLDLGGPMSRAESDAKLDRYVATFNRCGVCRLAVESRDGDFLGYAGVMPSREDHPLGPHFDIGWRLTRSAWSRGYATEAARCLIPGFDGALFSSAWRDALWVRFFMAAPRRQRQSVERYNIVKRA